MKNIDNSRLPYDAKCVLTFWFGDNNSLRQEAGSSDTIEARNALWFGSSPENDSAIRQGFSALLAQALGGELDSWSESAGGRLALIVLLDQFTRNIYRGEAAAFSGDVRALAICKRGLALKQHLELSLIARSFFYMPLEHSERHADQLLCVKLFEQLLNEAPDAHKLLFENTVDYARQHEEIVRQFGRFPHRNKVLGRESTKAELVFLQAGGASFGQG